MTLEIHDTGRVPLHVYVDTEGHAALRERAVEFGGRGRATDLDTLAKVAGVPVYVDDDECPVCARDDKVRTLRKVLADAGLSAEPWQLDLMVRVLDGEVLRAS